MILKFRAFDCCKAGMKKQYENIIEIINKDESEKLYEEVRNIYYSADSLQIGRGLSIKYFFENVSLFINPDDVFADLANLSNTPINLRFEQYNKYRKYNDDLRTAQDEGALQADCDFGHTSPDWDEIFTTGLHGIIKKAENALKNPNLTQSQKDFYLSVKYAYEGIIIYIERLAQKAGSVMSANAQFAAKNLRKLAKGKPDTLAEAMQLYFIYYAAQHHVEGENLRSLGAVDKILYSYYKHDIEKGIFNEEEIRELIKYFLYKWYSMEILANIPFNLCTEVNDITYMIIEEYTKLDIHDPKMHIKCSDDLPEKVYRLVMDSIRGGKNSFVFMNNEAVHKALMNIGIEKEDAERYTVIGCYEPSAEGHEIPCTLNGRINMPMAIETVLNHGKRYGSDKVIGIDFVNDFADFEALYNAVKKQLSKWSEMAIAEVNELEKDYPQINQSPIISGTYENCMRTGVDAYSGGAKYNNSSICAFGIGTITDELVAIKKVVYEEKILSLDELKKILKNNWKGSEALRKMIQDKYPKYGNNDKEADDIALELEKHMSDCINNKPNGRGGVFRLGFFSIDWIIDYGKKLGATADGRLAGEPVSKNICASVGIDKKGVTGIISSAAKFDYSLISDGTVLDLSIHPTVVENDKGLDIMTNLVKLYFKKGGFAVHINVLNPETLRKAQQNPEKYKNLQVRLCGWNVYFTDLSRERQDNLIKSMEN